MNDFMPKPIELGVFLTMVKTWLPDDKIIELSGDDIIVQNEVEEELTIPGLNVKEAVHLIGSVTVYKDVLSKYYKNIEKKKQVISDAYEQGDWDRYTTEVHALKSSSRQIGAVQLGDLAEKLEKAGNAKDILFISENTSKLLETYVALKGMLEPFVTVNDEMHETTVMSDDEIREILRRLVAAIADLDSTTIEELIQTLTKVSAEEPICTLSKKMKEAAEEYDYELCEELAEQWLEKLSETM